MTTPDFIDVPTGKKLSPARIVLLYAGLGAGWILFSDTLTTRLVEGVEHFKYIAILKGLFSCVF